MTVFKVEGVEEALRKLNSAIDGIEGNTKDGVALAAQFVKGESQHLTSIDTGNLINSAFAKPINEGAGQVVGYSAKYAAAVHEMPKDTNWHRPGAENKFLEKAVLRHLGEIFNLIQRVASRNP